MRSVPSITSVVKNRLILTLLGIGLFTISQAQIPANQWAKLSPALQKKWQHKPAQSTSHYIVAVKDFTSFKNEIQRNDRVKIMYEYPSANVFVIRTTRDEILKSILTKEEVVFIDEQKIAKEEVAVSNLDLSANKINLIHDKFPQFNGTGQVVSVKEGLPDITDIDFQGRFLITASIPYPPGFSPHATIMATIIGGGGNSYYEGKGGAWGSTISSTPFAFLLPEPDTFYQQHNITVQNHSYGVGIENFYGADAAAYDASSITRAPLLHVMSTGNSGGQLNTTGPYANIPGYANMTGSFKMAKNIITVGNTDSLGQVIVHSSRGPAYDGRVKPELVAFSEDGSSGAGAIVSGISLTLQQAHKDLHGNLPSSALIKAILLNSADDAGNKGIDFISGFGSVNAYKAMQGVINTTHFNGTIGNGGNDVFNLTVPANTGQLKITLTWNDPPAVPNASKALKNDLDLELSLPAAGLSWQPWVLNHFPHIDSLKKLPVRKRDSLNNVEQITIDNPLAGNYQIKVNGFNVPASPPQPYFVAYRFDTLDKFNWLYPTKSDNIFGNRGNLLRWESTYGNITGGLEYSINNGIDWQLIDNAIDLSKGYYKWTPPDSFVTALLRMNFASQNFRSDTFTISKRFDVHVGFNCKDSFMLFWNKIPGISNYQLYRLGNKYMESFQSTSDTAVILSKQSNPSLHYAVAPVINGKNGLRSYTYNYTSQGVGCYIKTFLAQLVGNTVRLDLELGTTYNLRSITWQKLNSTGFVDLQTINTFPGSRFMYLDNSLTRGLNVYRVKIELLNGQVIFSEAVTVHFFQDDLYILYPNPATQYNNIIILSNNPGITQLQVFNSAGIKIYELPLNDLVNFIPPGKLSKGFYFLRIMKENKMQTMFKLVVL